jgi:hypothetical protein
MFRQAEAVLPGTAASEDREVTATNQHQCHIRKSKALQQPPGASTTGEARPQTAGIEASAVRALSAWMHNGIKEARPQIAST